MKIDHVVLRDPADIRANLLPVTYTRPISELRIGIITIREKWQRRLSAEYSWITADYLQEKFPPAKTSGRVLTINANILPTNALIAELNAIPHTDARLIHKGIEIGNISTGTQATPVDVDITSDFPVINWVYDIFMKNSDAIEWDFALMTAGRQSAAPDASCRIIGDPARLFIEPGAQVTGTFINVTAGPVYIASTATVMEGSCLRGPIACCEHSQVNMGTKIYGATTIGNYCKVGGELNNVVMQGYSNKAHDGFLGNAVIGEWCNLGAGCVASNLKNDYTEIKLWNYPAHRFLRTGLQFCGLIMADHSKAGINRMFNTATVVGVGCNIHGSGFPRNFVASFSEGSPSGYVDVSMPKFLDIARRMMARRGIELTEADIRMFDAIRHISDDYK